MEDNGKSGGFDVIVTHRPLSSSAVGGVAIALDSLIKENTRVYVVDNENFYPPGERSVEERLGNGGRQIRVRVPKWAMTANYEGLANGVLWPANHDMVDLIESGSSMQVLINWVRGNNVVTSRIREELSRNGTDVEKSGILVNDYQITGVGKGVYFHHTPFFSPETFHAAGELKNGHILKSVLKRQIESLTLYDAVGVQTLRDLQNLEVITDSLLDDTTVRAEGNALMVERGGHVTLMKAVPIGIDPDAIEKCLKDGSGSLDYALKDGRTFGEMLKEDRENGRRVIARVGRADYTKAYPENIDFIYDFARECAEDPLEPQLFRAYVVAAETRPNVPAYSAEMKKIKDRTGETNARWRDRGYDYDLIELVTEEVPNVTGLALMKNADVYADVSARDGMHLTPQESIVAMGANGGFVICGSNSGTGYLLKQAGLDGGAHGVLVVGTPSRVAAETSAALYKKNHRISESLLSYIRNNTVHDWSRDLQELSGANR